MFESSLDASPTGSGDIDFGDVTGQEPSRYWRTSLDELRRKALEPAPAGALPSQQKANAMSAVKPFALTSSGVPTDIVRAATLLRRF